MATRKPGQKPASKPKKTTTPPAAPKAAGTAAHPLRAEIARAAAAGFRFYVYTLADTDGVFYVGKGQGDRVFQHEKLPANDRNGLKRARLRACGAPIKTVVAYFRDEGAAFAHEAELIAAGAVTLTNMVGGTVTWSQSAAARFRSMLDSMAPFDQWAACLPPEKARRCCLIAGSVRRFYDIFQAVLESEAHSPTPRSMFIPHSKGFAMEVFHG